MNIFLILIATFIPQVQFSTVGNVANTPVTLGWADAVEFDTEYMFAVYVIRGGPKPERVPYHHWVRCELWDYQYSDGGAPFVWKLYRLKGAGPHRQTKETWPSGTWVPAELDTPQRRARRDRQGNSGLTNYEIYEEANDFAKN